VGEGLIRSHFFLKVECVELHQIWRRMIGAANARFRSTYKISTKSVALCTAELLMTPQMLQSSFFAEGVELVAIYFRS